jgi:putative SOS response-associated peptidase YedK
VILVSRVGIRASELLPLLRPYPADAMAAHPVSTAANDPRADGPELIAPLPLGPAEASA